MRPRLPKFIQTKNALPTMFSSGTNPQKRGILRVVAVVAHHEVVPRRHLADHALGGIAAILGHREALGVGAVPGRAPGLDADLVLDIAQLLGEQRRIAQAVVVVVLALGHRGHRLAVDRELLVQVGNLVAGQANDTLDVVQPRVHRVAEDHHVAALHGVVVDDLPVDHRQPHAVVKLVDQDEVADDQRRHHGTGRNLERLEQERAQQEHDQDHREQAGGPVQPPGLHQQLAPRLRDVAVDARDALRRQLRATRRILLLQRRGGGRARRGEAQPFGQPVDQRDQRQHEQQQREVARPVAQEPAAEIDDQGAVEDAGECTHVLDFSRRLGGWPGRPLVAPRRSRSASCASCRPSASRAASSCA